MQYRWWVVGALSVVGCSGGTTDPGDGSAAGAAGNSGSSGSGNAAAGGDAASGGTGTAGKAGHAGAAGASSSAGAAGTAIGGAAGTGGSGSAGASAGGASIPDDVGSGACHDFTPCAGDVVGDWTIDVCADPPLEGLKALCPAATETLSVSGTAQLRADGTMSSTLSITSETTLPASCVAELGTCGSAGQPLNLLADCTPGAAGSCICASVSDSEPSDATYTTTPAGLFTVVRDGNPNYSYYCRQGNDLWTRGVDPDNGRISVLHFLKQ